MSAKEDAPACPRCGYDQSGAVAAWERLEPAQCPVSGVCSECGLEFLWRELLNPVFREQVRLFEHARRHRVRSFFLTLGRLIRPWVFWRWVRMEHEIVWARLLQFIVLAAAVLLSLNMAVGMLLGGATYLILSRSRLGRYFSFEAQDLLLELAWPLRRPYGGASPHALVVLLTACLVPAAFATLPTTLRSARVRPSHIGRVWLYGIVFIPVLLSIHAVVRLAVTVVWSLWYVLAQQYSNTWGGPWSLAQGGPVTRSVGLGVAVLWLLLWWTMAVGRYLRLPRAPAVGVAMVAIAFLASLLIVLLIPGMGARLVLGW